MFIINCKNYNEISGEKINTRGEYAKMKFEGLIPHSSVGVQTNL